MAQPGFHGYGYGSWQTPGQYGSGVVSGRAHVFHHQTGLLGGRDAGSVVGKGGGPSMGQAGPGQAGSGKPIGWQSMPSGLEGPGGFAKETANKFKNRPRGQAFTDSASGPRYTGPATYDGAVGELGAGNQQALGRGYPNAIETTATMGALDRGPLIGAPGARPAGAAPTPFALPQTAGSSLPAKARSRKQSFGQMQFGEIPA